MASYSIDRSGLSISCGHRLHEPSVRPEAQSDPSGGWRIPSRPLLLADMVAETGRLLRAVMLGLGGGDHRQILIEGLRAVLAPDGRESALPVAQYLGEAGLRGSLARQARVIADEIVDLVHRQAADPTPADALDIRSPCEGHIWTPEVAALLMGRGGGPQVMQLYNEWQHQLVLARDALLPFTNWAEVPIPFDRLASKGGLRALESSRKAMAAELLMGRLSYDALIAHALAMQGEAAESGCYGFQTDAGLALPAFLGDAADGDLLTWHKAALIDAPSGHCIRFLYADQSYFDAPRAQIEAGQDAPPPPAHVSHGAIRPERIDDGRAFLTLISTVDGTAYSKDVGRIARGHRFGIRRDGPAAADPRAGDIARWHDAHTVLASLDLVTASGGVHAIPADSGGVLALLGTLYPENVIVARGESLMSLRGYGKGFGPLFVIGNVLP